ncbi:WXG100 family type VII secretion target [Nocardia sp. NPDC051321]|uniref:WXG100 family type VII secretion target n=1 Tax=Nocardia sp. NPDC051321 TaxID=3364323 RepID=UPI0037A690A0
MEQQVFVISGALRAIGGYADSQAQVLRSALNSVGEEVDELTSSGWTGDAAKSFAKGWSECRDAGAEIIATLTELATGLDAAATAYVDQDMRSGSDIRGAGQ